MEQVINEALTTLGVSGQHMYLENNQWFVAIREEIGYLVIVDDERGKVILDFPVCPLPPEADPEKLMAFLKFNALSAMYAGAKLHISAGDAFVLSLELPQVGIDGKTLAEALHSLVQAREVIEAILAGDPEDDGAVSDLTARSQWVSA